MRRTAIVGTVVGMLVGMITVRQAATALDNCTVLYPARAGWAIDVCATDEHVVDPMEVFVDGTSRGSAVGLRVYRRSPVEGHMPQVMVATSDGYVRLKPVDSPSKPIQFGTSFVLGPAYWGVGTGYHHNPPLSRLEVDTTKLPTSLGLRATGTNGSLQVSYDMALISATTDETRLHVTQTATATADIAVDPTRRAEQQGYKAFGQFSSMFINQGQPCFGGQFTNCNDANVVRYLARDGSEARLTLADEPFDRLIDPPKPLGDQFVELLQTDPLVWQGRTPSVRLLLDRPGDFTVQGYLAAGTDPRDTDNLGLWVQGTARATTGFRAGDRETVRYTLSAGQSRFPEVVGFTWFDDGTSAKTGPAGTRIGAYGTGLRPQTNYQLVTGRSDGGGSPCALDVAPVNGAIRRSNSSGFIGTTAGTVARAPGTWNVCFYEVEPSLRGRSAGNPLFFTVAG